MLLDVNEEPPLILYWIGAVPPALTTAIWPLFDPLHEMLVGAIAEIVGPATLLMLAIALNVHPF